MVERAVTGSFRCRIRLIGRVFEEENHAVNRLEGEKLRWVEGKEFFELDVFDAEILDEGGKDTLVAMLALWLILRCNF
jgi:hypothetical protein